ncbi:tetratricopeptide repeat protein [Flavihumibacter profundi]|uniref:tetratricopeptide repeat protein n=1 Tax=Flavihumibacter profundi TaxID=2716883 RepID=UPI001CC6E47F|nr:hypothetical protein [Flavihumibacter profundi]MBZ5857619.1 hypothetical protein [Flavihumibacter profundi]
MAINPAMVNEQLSQILSSETFQSSTILSRFLKFIVEETLAGNEAALKEYTIALKVLSKRPDFNPQLDPIVRIHAGRLRRSLREYYNNAGQSDTLIISMPRGSYVPAFSAIPAGEITRNQAAVKQEIIVGRKTSIAVLPFKNIGADASTGNFADGLGDRLSTELTRYPELAVVAYYSCRSIADKITDVKEAGAMLDAQYLLTGSVQRDDTHIRLTVQLILAGTREQVWANFYERDSNVLNLLEVQDEIVWQVVSQAAGHYGAILRNVSKIPPAKSIHDISVYEAIFWYYHFVNNLSEEIFHKAENAMQQAVEADPEYALGWAVLGELFVGGYFLGFQSKLTQQQLELAVVYGKKSIKTDPFCQHGYQTIALANLFLHNKTEAKKAIEAWMTIKPGAAGIMGAIGFCLICCGEYDRGFKLLDESIHLNPYYQWWFNGGLGFYHFEKKNYADSIYWAEKMNMPGVPWELLLKTASLAELDQMAEAQKCGEQLMQQFPFLKDKLREYTGAFINDEQFLQNLHKALLKAGVQ